MLSGKTDLYFAVRLSGEPDLAYYAIESSHVLTVCHVDEDVVFANTFVNLLKCVNSENFLVEKGVALLAHVKLNAERVEKQVYSSLLNVLFLQRLKWRELLE